MNHVTCSSVVECLTGVRKVIGLTPVGGISNFFSEYLVSLTDKHLSQQKHDLQKKNHRLINSLNNFNIIIIEKEKSKRAGPGFSKVS